MVNEDTKKAESDTESHGERRLYRQGSLSSQLHQSHGDIPMGAVMRNCDSKTNVSIRSRTPSGKSIRSRTATRAEYHEDLKKELKQGFTCHLLFLSFIIMMGNSFIFGYNIGVLNQPVMLIRQFYNSTYTNRLGPGVPVETEYTETNVTADELPSNVPPSGGVDEYMIVFLWSLTTTLFVIGGMIGAYSAGYLADRVGRKRSCLINCIPCFVGAVISTISVSANSPELLMLGRFITGINCGIATQLAPMYLLEISPFNLKGAFGTANQLFITIGIFVGSVFGLREILGTVTGWPYLLLLNIVPSFICLVCLPFLPDSPRYLMLSKKNREAAEKALQYIRQQSDVTADLEEMETELSDASGADNGKKEEESYTMLRLLKTKDLRMPLFVAVFLQVIQQLSGINAIFFYSTGIYANAGVPAYAIQYAVLVTNAINVIMTIVAVPIMDKAGRRPLLLYPMIVMVLILAFITMALSLQAKLAWMSYISIACVIGYVICFAVGLGPIPMMITAELFRQGPRPRAMSLAGLSNWFFTAIVAISFEMIQAVTKEYTFIIFLILMIGFTLFVFFKVPETKNKTFEEIASVFQPGGNIEVEEVVDYPIYTGNDQMDEESDFTAPTTRLMADEEKSNGVVANGVASADHGDVAVKVVDEEKQGLKTAVENV